MIARALHGLKHACHPSVAHKVWEPYLGTLDMEIGILAELATMSSCLEHGACQAGAVFHVRWAGHRSRSE